MTTTMIPAPNRPPSTGQLGATMIATGNVPNNTNQVAAMPQTRGAPNSSPNGSVSELFDK